MEKRRGWRGRSLDDPKKHDLFCDGPFGDDLLCNNCTQVNLEAAIFIREGSGDASCTYPLRAGLFFNLIGRPLLSYLRCSFLTIAFLAVLPLWRCVASFSFAIYTLEKGIFCVLSSSCFLFVTLGEGSRTSSTGSMKRLPTYFRLIDFDCAARRCRFGFKLKVPQCPYIAATNSDLPKLGD